MPAKGVDWEQWIGIRGAAVLGAIVLGLAAVMFLRYAIEHGLIPPIVRVAIGLLVGLASIAISEGVRTRGYRTTANALAGGGIVVLYVSVWSARVLYELIGAAPAYGLMILVTVSCGLLAWRHHGRDIALLGLVGGFATPLLLSSGSDNPIGLFGYVLQLDLGLFTLARRGRWPVLMVLALAGTALYEAAWILGRMGPERLLLGLVVVAVFGVFFALTGKMPERGDSAGGLDVERLTRIGGVLLPFAFALYFAGNAELGTHLYPIAALLLLLLLTAGWVGRSLAEPFLPVGAAAGTTAVLAAWFVRTRFTDALAWEAAAACLILALAPHLWYEWLRRHGQEGRSQTDAALGSSVSFLILLVLFSLSPPAPSLWPWLCGWLALAALVLRQTALSGRNRMQVPLGFLLGAGFAWFFLVHRDSPAFPAPALYLGIVVAVALGFQALAWRRLGSATARAADAAAAAFPLTVLLFLLGESLFLSLTPGLFLGATFVLALLAVLSATRMRSGPIYFAAVLLLACVQWVWTLSFAGPERHGVELLLALLLESIPVLAFTVWPLLVGGALAGERFAWYGAALAAPLWFPSMRYLFELRFGDAAIGLLPVALGALSLWAAFQARRLGKPDDPARNRALVWFAAVALGFVSVAIPLQLEKEWITLGWALQGFAVIALWKRLDHPGLKYFGLALLAAVTVRLVANPEVLSYHPRSGWPIVNWLMYTYLVPAAALLGAASILRRHEIGRRRPWEFNFYSGEHPVGAMGCGVAAIAVVFVWINLTIFDFYSTGSELTLSLDRLAARDLTLSLAWAVYALVLLGIGFRRDSVGLRWVSLAFLVLTIGKVFLHDLGELEDLYRVASLVGLAVSLILVSFAYQRFVFRKRESE